MNTSLEHIFSDGSSSQDKDLMTLYCATALQLYRKYPGYLVMSSFREKIAEADQGVGTLLSWIYEERRCTRKDIRQRYQLLLGQSKTIQVQTALPDMVKQLIQDPSVRIEQVPDIGLFAECSGRIYKRFIPSDIHKLLA